MNALKEVPLPHWLQDAEKDHRGWPITFTSIQLPDGRYDFTTTDPLKWAYVTSQKCCAICGKPLVAVEVETAQGVVGGFVDCWFIGGPKTMAFRHFWDPPMHEECARYSLVVCPYISMPKYLGAKARLVPQEYRQTLASADLRKPDVFGLARTLDYRVVEFQGDILIHAGNWIQDIEWWKDGVQTTELVESTGLMNVLPVPAEPDLTS